VTVAGSHSPPSENTLGTSVGEAAGGFVSNTDQTAAVFAEGETPKPVNAAPGSDRATEAADIRTGGNSPADIAAVSAGEVRNPEPGASDRSKASAPIPSEPTAQQMAARIDDNSKRIPEPLAGERAQRVPPPAGVPAAPARNPATKASPSGLSGAEVEALLARGDALVAKGDIASARLFYERAAEAGDGQAALRLGESYDPAFLAQAHLSGVRGDAVAAAHWYQRARELGITEAETLLQTILPEKDQRRP
jgi:TPR repeat protein